MIDNSCKSKTNEAGDLTQGVIRAEESAEEASDLDANNLRIEGVWVWYHGRQRVGARRT